MTLAPCPICKQEPKVIDDPRNDFRVIACYEISDHNLVICAVTLDAAIAKWNATFGGAK
jgi:hypothetical protein